MKIRAPSRASDDEGGLAGAVLADQNHGLLTPNLGSGAVNLQEVAKTLHGLGRQRPLQILEELRECRLTADLFPSARQHKTAL